MEEFVAPRTWRCEIASQDGFLALRLAQNHRNVAMLIPAAEPVLAPKAADVIVANSVARTIFKGLSI